MNWGCPRINSIGCRRCWIGWLPKRSCTNKGLESLIHLSHAATVVRPDRTFLQQFFILLNTVNAPHHFIHLNALARADLQCFLQDWNGTSLLPPPFPSVHVYLDTSGPWGCGALVQGMGWFQLRWLPEWCLIDILSLYQWCCQLFCWATLSQTCPFVFIQTIRQ